MARYSWIRLDNTAGIHDRVLALPDDAARWQWVVTLMLASQRDSADFSGRTALLHAHVTDASIDAMLSAGLLTETGGTLTIRDWQDYQPRQVAIDPSRVGAHPGRARDAHPTDATRGRNLTRRDETRRNESHSRASAKTPSESWVDYDRIEWQPFREAWIGRGFLWAPSGEQDGGEGQRAILWEIAAARPVDLGRWVTEAPRSTGSIADSRRAVIAYVIDQWHAVKAAIEPDPVPRRRPPKRAAPSRLSTLLADAFPVKP
jgi:hypothetical protein